MNPEIKAKWIEALRSGSYEQGKACLRRDNQFCCLGVLCDLVDPQGWAPFGNGFEHREHDGYPDTSVEKVTGLNDTYHIDRLVSMNDHGKTFRQIADYIETNL